MVAITFPQKVSEKFVGFYQSPGGGGRNREVGREVLWARQTLHEANFSAPHRVSSHTSKRRLHPQHSTEVSPQQHDAGHEAFLSLGSALICWQSMRKTWMTG